MPRGSAPNRPRFIPQEHLTGSTRQAPKAIFTSDTKIRIMNPGMSRGLDAMDGKTLGELGIVPAMVRGNPHHAGNPNNPTRQDPQELEKDLRSRLRREHNRSDLAEIEGRWETLDEATKLQRVKDVLTDDLQRTTRLRDKWADLVQDPAGQPASREDILRDLPDARRSTDENIRKLGTARFRNDLRSQSLDNFADVLRRQADAAPEGSLRRRALQDRLREVEEESREAFNRAREIQNEIITELEWVHEADGLGQNIEGMDERLDELSAEQRTLDQALRSVNERLRREREKIFPRPAGPVPLPRRLPRPPRFPRIPPELAGPERLPIPEMGDIRAVDGFSDIPTA